MKGSCFRCIFWSQEVDPYQEGEMFNERAACVRFPPIPYTGPPKFSEYGEPMPTPPKSPVTLGSFWCGEYSEGSYAKR